MSRLPTLSTPHRLGTPPTPSGIPTPTTRRTRSSLGTNTQAPVTPDSDALDQLQAALKRRPPSSMQKLLDEATESGDPDTPTHSTFASGSGGLAPPAGIQPRTPIARARTPNLGIGGRPSMGFGAGAGAPVTPSASTSRSSSRPSIGGMRRPSMGGGTTSGISTPRRVSTASSTLSTTPYARRPESRLGGGDSAGTAKFAPQVGDRVKMQGMGMEGTLRFLGATQFKEGVWAGVELEGGFKGMGKNDGSVDGVEYFSCPPKCGVFILSSRLAAPTARPASVASHISHASQASQASGRMTPAHDRIRPATTTPGKARTVSTSVRGATRLGADPPEPLPEDARPQRTMLGISTSTNANSNASKITAGSRASKYVGMTAKQLASAREGTLGASIRGGVGAGLDKSTATVMGFSTPKASRVSMGMATPAGGIKSRQSLGGHLVTPRARPRASAAHDAMPPPRSPGKSQAATAQLELQIRKLQARNTDLEAQLSSALAAAEQEDNTADLEVLRNEIEAAQKEADELRHSLAQTQEDARQAADLAEDLLNKEKGLEEEVELAKKEVERVNKESKVELERTKGELEAGLEAKRGEVKVLEGRLGEVEAELGEAEGHVEELRAAGQATISLYEQKLSDQETRSYELEDRIRSLEDKLTKSESDRMKLADTLASASSVSSSSPPVASSAQALSAVEIDNETLSTQIQHLQSKILHLEEHLEEARAQLESEAEAWKARLEKSRASEKERAEAVRALREEVGTLQSQAKGAKGRIGELEGALTEVRAALEGARGEIEGLRSEAAEAASLRTALQKAATTETALTNSNDENRELKKRMLRFDEMRRDCEKFEAQVATLQAELTSLERRSPRPRHDLYPQPVVSPSRKSSASSLNVPAMEAHHRKPRLSTGSAEGDEQKMHGYHHIIKELNADNAELARRVRTLEGELDLAKEEIKLMDDIREDEPSRKDAGEGDAEGARWKVKAGEYAANIKVLEREMSELESLIENKIYHQDDLENRIHELEREVRVARSQAQAQAQAQMSSVGHGHAVPAQAQGITPTRTSSLANRTQPLVLSGRKSPSGSARASSTSGSVHTAEEYPSPPRIAGTGPAADVRCELCEGPHDLDACPVFAQNLDTPAPATAEQDRDVYGGGRHPDIDLRGQSKRRCADCDSTGHDTADCPLADDVF